MTEKIGQVTLDYTHYSGKDLYCDGPTEDKLLNIVKNNSQDEYKSIIEEEKTWEVYYHLSEQRQNIVNWINFTGKEKILEVGSGCGAITGALAYCGNPVDCVELSKKRSMINAYRNSDRANVTIHVGNFKDIEPDLSEDYDYIFLIGVLEYALSYIGGENPYEDFLKILKKHLKPTGQMIIAIENRMGMKYLAGCKEDHYGSFFAGVEGYPVGQTARTFTRPVLEKVFKNAGIDEKNIHFYYPYPDYKFMTTLYSDKRLPFVGELANNMRNFDTDRLLLFDEKEAFDGVIKEGNFPYFSNSYLVVIGSERENIYVKYSNDRAPQYSICTSIIEDVFSEKRGSLPTRLVIKYPIFEESTEHTSKLFDSYKTLSAMYDGDKLRFNECKESDEVAVFSFEWGKTLDELLDEKCEKSDKEGFVKLVEEYRKRITPKADAEKKIYDEDLIFPNIIVNNGVWTVIDYEWVKDEEITVDEMTARALYCFSLGSVKRKKMAIEVMKELLEMGQIDYNRIAKAEEVFQQKATGDFLSQTELRNEFGHAIIPVTALAHEYSNREHRMRVQIYEDYGEGLNEENSYFYVKGYEEGKEISVDIDIKTGIQHLRIDPCIDFAMVKLGIIEVGGVILTLKSKNIHHNGFQLGDDTLVFDSEDPWIQINFNKKLNKKLKKMLGDVELFSARVTFTTSRLPQEMIKSIIGK